jgi:MYXO-CTERM domain-containing protein
VSCTSDAPGTGTVEEPVVRASEVPNYFAGPPDTSHVEVQRGARVQIAQPHSSLPFRDIPLPKVAPEEHEHPPLLNPIPFALHDRPDPVVQSRLPIASMPVAIQNFLGQGTTREGCVFPNPPAGCTTKGDPPDTEGAVGPNHYVQIVNSGVAVWDKAGNVLMAPKFTNLLWTGFPTTDGNQCAAQDWGDGVVLYDQMADRWFITQFDVTNFVNSSSGPSFQCVAVSKTADPTGAYWLYDFKYTAAINDYGKFSVWPDAYYATFNNFGAFAFSGANACAYDRASMLQGLPATQQCFQQSGSVFGLLPGNLDGPIPPPRGEPAFFMNFGSATSGSSVGLYKFHVDWTTPASSTFTGPTSLPVASFTITCPTQTRHACIPQPSPGNALESLADRLMFRLVYRNFGTHESLLANHAVQANGTGGVRWYEIRSPNGTPSVFQQGTYAPNDGNWRWMASIAQDQAQDFALGYSVSSATMIPALAWTGRTAADPAGTMGQAEAIFDNGGGVETGTTSSGQTAERWGDYSNMTVDPVDDCTFWYTQEAYPANGIFNWDTHIASVKFPNCAQNDFTIAIAPPTQNLQQGKSVTYTVSTTLTKGTAESIALNIQDVPAGVTATLSPTTINAGGTSTLTMNATAATPLVGPTQFVVIGKAPSAVHAAKAQVAVVACQPTACGAGQCGVVPDGCGGTHDCGGCTAPQTCGGGGTPNVCGCTPVACTAGQCGMHPDGCGGMHDCGGCTAPQTCGGGGTAGVCGCTPTTCTAGQCGALPDGCGGTKNCPGCTAPQTCGGGGTPGMCGCTPVKCDADAGQCGTMADGCGATHDCGGCTSPDTCGGGGTANVCGCTPKKCTAGQCGTVSNGCGGTNDCGGCTAPQTCGGGGTQGVCGCTPKACQPGDCGQQSNGCGGTNDCGACGSDAGQNDSGAPAGDSGSTPGSDGGAADDGGSGGGGGGDSGGCGCKVESTRTSSTRLAGVGVAFGVLLLRRRRRR